MPLLNVTLPANAAVFFRGLMTFAAFDIIDTSPYLNYLLALNPSEPVNNNFEALGFESIFLLHNVGSLIFAFLFYPLAIVTMLLLKKMTSSERAQEWASSMASHLFYGFLITTLTESYALLAVSSLINLNNLQWTSFGFFTQSSATLLFSVLIVGYPVAMSYLFLTNFEQLEDPEF